MTASAQNNTGEQLAMSSAGFAIMDQRAVELIDPIDLRLLQGGYVALSGHQLMPIEGDEGFVAERSASSRLVVPQALSLAVLMGQDREETIEVAAVHGRIVGGEVVTYAASFYGITVLPVID